MYSTCLFCKKPLGANEAIERFPVGRRLAFDTARGRLWVVCSSCARWNLTPLEERWEAIEECERRFRDTRVRVSTANVGLAKLSEGLELVRIGKPLRPEFAAWRYGHQLGRRRRNAQLVAGAGVAAAAVGAVALGPTIAPALTLGAISIVVVPGITTIMGAIPMIGMVVARDYLVHDRVVARLAQGRRVITVRAKHLGDVELHVDRDGATSLDVPHDRGWARFGGMGAIHSASVLLAGANRFGASAAQVDGAVKRIEAVGDATGYLAEASTLGGWRHNRVFSLLNGYRGLGALRLSPTEALALEMAMHEESERRALEGELAQLAVAWQQAEEIAAIADGLLAPPLPDAPSSGIRPAVDGIID